MSVGWLTTAIFGDLAGHVFENFGDTASNTIRNPLIAKLMTLNDLEGYFVSKSVFCQHFVNQSV